MKEDILLNKCLEINASQRSYAYSFLGVFVGITCTLIATTYPQHYPIGHPEYWYESLLVVIFGYLPVGSVQNVNLFLFCIGIIGQNTIILSLFAYGFGTLSACSTSVILYLTWVQFAGLSFPMPFQGYVVSAVAYYTIFVVFCFQCS